MEITAAHEACFEAGVKFGSLYHQFAGAPVSPETAASLERAIEESIQNQPACESVSVEIDPGEIDTTHGYDELAGRHMTVRIEVHHDGVVAVAKMAMTEGYPLMRLVDLSAGDGDP
ncbi:MAG: dihydroneopterin aldolase family protein [Haloarculaceae archaeon]